MNMLKYLCLRTLVFAVIVIVCAMTFRPGHAEPTNDIRSTIEADVVPAIKDWLTDPVVLIALEAQNKRHESLDQEEILALDKMWRNQVKSSNQPLIAQLFGSPLSTFLTRIQAGSLGLYSEIFVMDNKGLNVGLSSVSSDYWQGDEGKWQKTFLIGPDAVFIDDQEYHKGTGTYRVQVNLAIADPKTNETLGAITVEINLTELTRRQMLGTTG